MLSKEELHEINLKTPQAIAYLVEVSTKLLFHIQELEYELDIYKAKYKNAENLRKIHNDKAISSPN